MTNCIRTVFLYLFFSLVVVPAFSADGEKVGFPGGKSYLYRVYLTDKKDTPYSLKKPWVFLSAKSLERRSRQGLSVDSTDLPHSPAYLRTITNVEGVEIVSKSKWNNTVLVLVHDKKLIKPIESLKFVSKVQKVFESPDSITPSVRYMVNEESEVNNSPDDVYGKASKNIELVNGKFLHDMGFKGRGMTIAVLDGGFMNVDRIPMMKEVKILDTT